MSGMSVSGFGHMGGKQAMKLGVPDVSGAELLVYIVPHK